MPFVAEKVTKGFKNHLLNLTSASTLTFTEIIPLAVFGKGHLLNLRLSIYHTKIKMSMKY